MHSIKTIWKLRETVLLCYEFCDEKRFLKEKFVLIHSTLDNIFGTWNNYTRIIWLPFFTIAILNLFLVFQITILQLRFTLFCFTYLLTSAQRRLLSIPVFYIIEWCLGQHASSGNYLFIFNNSFTFYMFS